MGHKWLDPSLTRLIIGRVRVMKANRKKKKRQLGVVGDREGRCDRVGSDAGKQSFPL